MGRFIKYNPWLLNMDIIKLDKKDKELLKGKEGEGWNGENEKRWWERKIQCKMVRKR